MTPKPVVQALVLADHIYREPVTGKVFILGTFNALVVDPLPGFFSRSTFAYLCLTDVYGNVDIVLRYCDLATNEILMETNTLRAHSPDRFSSIEAVLPVPPFPIPHAGVYSFEVHSGTEMLGSLRIHIGPEKE